MIRIQMSFERVICRPGTRGEQTSIISPVRFLDKGAARRVAISSRLPGTSPSNHSPHPHPFPLCHNKYLAFPFQDPRLKNIALGSAEWFAAQRIMVKAKPLIHRCYNLWYSRLLADADSVPPAFRDRMIVELGSGSSYIKELRPEVVTSDVEPGMAEMVIDGRELPFPDQSVRALLLTHVFHHIPDVSRFLHEASRVLVPGGVISMVDETHTPFARFFFGKIHPEPYNDRSPTWSFPEGHTMLDSNQALTWIVFDRDRDRFAREFPGLKLEQRCYLPWFSYLMSGGVNLRTFFPAFLTPAIGAADRFLKPLDRFFAIHWHLTIRKEGGSAN